MLVFSPVGIQATSKHPFYFGKFVSERKEVIHTVLYVVHSMQSEVLSKKTREQHAQKSMKINRQEIREKYNLAAKRA